MYPLLPPHSSAVHLDSSLVLMVGHVYLVDHFIPTDCVPSQHGAEHIVNSRDGLTEQESTYCHPQHSFFPFCKTAACLEVYAIFRASPVTQSQTSKPSLAGAVWLICFCFNLILWQKFLHKTPKSREPRDSESRNPHLRKGNTPKCHRFHDLMISV